MPRMAQTPRGIVVELAVIHTLTIQDVFLAVQSKGAAFASGRFRDCAPLKFLDNDKAIRPLFCVFPNGADVNRRDSN